MEIDWFEIGSGVAIVYSIVKGFVASHQAKKANVSAEAVSESSKAYESKRLEDEIRMQERIANLEAMHKKDVERLEGELAKGGETFKEISQQLSSTKDMFQNSIQSTNAKLDRLLGFFDGMKIFNDRTLDRN